MLSRNAIYSPYYEEHRYEMKTLFKLFYYAKDFQTFYKTAAWARLHLNDGIFSNALTIAIFYRLDCKYMRLPAPYEIYPNLYFDNNVIQQAHDIKMTRGKSNYILPIGYPIESHARNNLYNFITCVSIVKIFSFSHASRSRNCQH